MWCFWAPKGGAGCSVVAAATAVVCGRASPTLLLDLQGDQAELLGVPADRAGLFDWLVAADPPPDSLARLEVEVAPGLHLLPWGTGRSTPVGGHATAGDRAQPDRVEALARHLAGERRTVVVDVGFRPASGDDLKWRAQQRLLAMASRSTMVIRPCRLSLAAARRRGHPDDIVVVDGPGRSARIPAVEEAAGAPVAAGIRWDRRIGRAVDRGPLTGVLPRRLEALAEAIR